MPALYFGPTWFKLLGKIPEPLPVNSKSVATIASAVFSYLQTNKQTHAAKTIPRRLLMG